MSELLEKLFNIPNFGIILFGSIAVLTVMFVVLFTLAMNDIKKKKAMEAQKEEPTANPFAQMPSVPVDVEVKEEVMPVLQNPVVEEEPKITVDEVEASNIDLQNIAMSLAENYQEEKDHAAANANNSEEFVVEPITKIEEPTPATMPRFNDLPTPQPIKVVSETKILDSSQARVNTDVNTIQTEEYNLNR